MATLVLTVVGGAVGGPIGAALGAAAGSAIDRTLFKTKAREGPRLAELAVQTSSYGTPIPKLFGTMRVAGTVIWSTDLIEHAATEGGGKGGGGTVHYTYSASFAVLLSARPIRAVKRIWADGNLLRGAAGDFKVPVTMRVHLGDEAQAADPLIASAEGAGATPACRGQAYVVLEQLPLADYGNRIPSLTFEIEADEAAPTIGAIAAAVSDGLVVGGEAMTTLEGFSAYGATLRDVVDGLAAAGGAWFASEGDGLALRAGSGVTAVIADDGVGARTGRRGVRTLAPADAAPRSLIREVAVTGVSVRPPSPVHGSARITEDGIAIGWVRRSRAGWRWLDGVDAPLAEEAERYQVTVMAGTTPLSRFECAAPTAVIDAALIMAGATAALVSQAGTFGLSPPTRIALSGG